ncbi:hypothetical protein MBLNU459_g6097t1 [Dothideomycetes sp. NU459]
MSAPRPTQFIALRRLAASSRQCRQLHMTGPATFPSPLLTAERPASNLPRDIAGLRAECKRRKIDISGTKQDLMSRLSADDLAHSRAFSSAVESIKRPSVDKSFDDAKPAVRHFNTSRALKANNDSSTIDFAFLPDFDPDNKDAFPIRVPLVPTNFSPSRTGAHAPEVEDAAVMRPTISTMSADTSNIHAMSEVTDNSAAPIDFHAMAESVVKATNKIKAPIVEQSGIVKTLWDGMVEDIRGTTKKAAA